MIALHASMTGGAGELVSVAQPKRLLQPAGPFIVHFGQKHRFRWPKNHENEVTMPTCLQLIGAYGDVMGHLQVTLDMDQGSKPVKQKDETKKKCVPDDDVCPATLLDKKKHFPFDFIQRCHLKMKCNFFNIYF